MLKMDLEQPFALIVSPAEATNLTSRRIDFWSACVLDGESFTFEFSPTREELVRKLDENGVEYRPEYLNAPLPSFENETLALSMLADELAKIDPDLPEGFVLADGIETSKRLGVKVTPDGLAVRVERGLAAELGWAEGDEIVIGINSETNELAITRGRGVALEADEDQRWLTTRRSVSLGGYQEVCGERAREPEWIFPDWSLTNGSLVFRIVNEARSWDRECQNLILLVVASVLSLLLITATVMVLVQY